MESKVKVGDRVRLNPETTQGLGYRDFRGKDAVIINAYPHIDLYEISIGNKPISTSAKSNELVMVEPYDPKTAFLSDLVAVLRKHNAVINVGWNNYFDTDKSPRIDIDIMFKDGNEGICFEDVLNKTITADNIMDYDKE